MSESCWDKFCFFFDHPKRFFCLSLEKGAIAVALFIWGICIATFATLGIFFINNAGGMKPGERITFAFYIFEAEEQSGDEGRGWDGWEKFGGGVYITFAIALMIVTIIGLVGIFKRKPLFINIYCWVAAVSCGVLASLPIILAINADAFTIASGAAWATAVLLFFAIIAILGILLDSPVRSLYLKLRREKEEKQVARRSLIFKSYREFYFCFESFFSRWPLWGEPSNQCKFEGGTLSPILLMFEYCFRFN